MHICVCLSLCLRFVLRCFSVLCSSFVSPRLLFSVGLSEVQAPPSILPHLPHTPTTTASTPTSPPTHTSHTTNLPSTATTLELFMQPGK